MGSRLHCDPSKLHQTLKDTVFKGATDSELLALVVVANEYGLNPLTKELYAFPAKGGGIVPVVSVDGWVRMVNDHPQMDGIEFEIHKDATGKLDAMTCSIWRKDRSRPIRVTEHLAECKRNTEPWKMENRMLRHKALMQCARYAFGFSGVTDDDEAIDQGERMATGRVIEPEVNPFAERKAIGIEAAPADDAPPFPTEEAPGHPPAEATAGNVIVGYFEKFEVKEGTSKGKPWKMWRVHYSVAGGAFKEAVTFSATIGADIGWLSDGDKIEIEVEAGDKGDTIKSIGKVEGGAA
jgi:phage recombination protein Bet